jgi:MYXO-CTERM domain-containing protein
VTSATSIAYHPDWNIDDLDAGNDIAVMHLADEVPIQPAAIRTQPLTASDLGASISLVGWGITGGGQEDSGIKRQVTSRLDEVSDNLVMVGNPDTNTCSGDSGGPTFYDAGAGPEIIGVTSFGDADCREYGISTRVDVFLDFIEASSVPGGGAGGGGGFGDACSEGAQCDSGVCVTDANGENGFCSELCDGDSCPSGSSCEAIDEENSVCLPAEQSGGQLGDDCTAGEDCASGLCATSATGGMCTAECESSFDCPNGFSCEAVDGGTVCLLDQGGSGGFPTPIASEDEGGCSAGGGAGGGAAMLFLLALALVPIVRRRSPSRASR